LLKYSPVSSSTSAIARIHAIAASAVADRTANRLWTGVMLSKMSPELEQWRLGSMDHDEAPLRRKCHITAVLL